MPKLLFENCCFCVDLRLGCFIIGYLNLIGSIIGVIMSIVAISAAASLYWNYDAALWEVGEFLLAMSIITLIVVAVLFSFSVVLLVGLHTNKRGHVKYYLIYAVVYMVISLVLFIANVAAGPIDTATIISRLVGLLFGAYIILVIRSYYYKMVDQPEVRWTAEVSRNQP